VRQPESTETLSRDKLALVRKCVETERTAACEIEVMQHLGDVHRPELHPLHVEDRAEQRRPPNLEVDVPLESAL